MLVTNGVLRHQFEQQDRPDRRTGRHLELDARSLEYTVERHLEARRPSIKPAAHYSNLNTLDQSHLHAQGIVVPGNPDGLGSCTGNAATNALGALYGSALSSVSFGGVSLSNFDSATNERFAIAVYEAATRADGFPGDFPPDDTGSSGLAVCKVLKRAGLIGGYRWSTTYEGIGRLLQDQGVMLGTPWYRAWFEPDSDGFVDADPNWMASGVAGGHEYYGCELERWDDRDPRKSVLVFDQSWNGWGDHGKGRMRFSTFLAVKQQSDVKQLQAKQ